MDRDGAPVPSAHIAAALNAAPTRAFEELTVEALGAMRDAARLEAFEQTSRDRLDGPLCAAWRAAMFRADDESLLAALQAFAAPQGPRWLPITVEAVSGKGHLLLRPSKISAPCNWPTVAELVSSDRVPGEFEWMDEGGCSYSFGCFDGYMPLTPLFTLEEPKWLPMATQPVDGTPVLVKFRDGARRAWPELGLTGASRSGCRVMRRDGRFGWRDDAASGLHGISDEWLAGWAPLPVGDAE